MFIVDEELLCIHILMYSPMYGASIMSLMSHDVSPAPTGLWSFVI